MQQRLFPLAPAAYGPGKVCEQVPLRQRLFPLAIFLVFFFQLSRWALVLLPKFAGLGLLPLGAPSVTDSASTSALGPITATPPVAVVAVSANALPICQSFAAPAAPAAAQSTGLGEAGQGAGWALGCGNTAKAGRSSVKVPGELARTVAQSGTKVRGVGKAVTTVPGLASFPPPPPHPKTPSNLCSPRRQQWPGAGSPRRECARKGSGRATGPGCRGQPAR